MKALTVYQPWASLIVLGFKPYEFRGWAAPGAIVGQRIGIHAASRKVKNDEVAGLIKLLRSSRPHLTGLRPGALAWLESIHEKPDALWLSAVVGTAVLGKPEPAEAIEAQFGGSGRAINDSDRDEHARWAWPMWDIEPMEPPIAARGAQGFWNWEVSKLTEKGLI